MSSLDSRKDRPCFRSRQDSAFWVSRAPPRPRPGRHPRPLSGCASWGPLMTRVLRQAAPIRHGPWMQRRAWKPVF
eukprot:949213-Pyramimonas_sp.AAC.1